MIDHILGHKSSLGKFKKIEIVSSIVSNHNAMRLDINYRKKSVKNTNTWRLNNTLLNNQELTEEIKEEIDSNTIIVGDFNTSLTPMDRSSKMKINKETQALNDTLNKMDLIDIYRTVHPKTSDYTSQVLMEHFP